MDRRQMRVDSRPVASRNGPRELETVVDGASHQRQQSFRRSAGLFEEAARQAMERDEIVRGHRRSRVVEDPCLIAEFEWAQPQLLREPEAARARVVGFGGHGRPRAVELFGSSGAGEGLQRMDAETSHMRCERGERGRSADMRHPWARRDVGCHVPNRRIWHAQQDEIRLLLVQGDAPLAKSRADRRSDAAVADNPDGGEHERSL